MGCTRKSTARVEALLLVEDFLLLGVNMVSDILDMHILTYYIVQIFTFYWYKFFYTSQFNKIL